MPNKRIFYAVQQVGIAQCGSNTFTAVHGLQSVGINTRFNLEQVFEIGQISIYQNIENLPDIEVTMEKVMDGYAPLYMLMTKGSTSPSLSGRSNVRATIGLSIFSDVQDSASGTPLAQCTVSGVYCSALSWTLPTNGNFTESVTAVGNNKFWNNAFTSTTFTNADEPLAIAGSGGVNRRQDLILGETTGDVSRLPQDIPGVSSSGYLPYDTVLQQFAAHLSSIRVQTNLGREALFELGRRGVYHRYATFPVEVKTDIELTAITGDNVTALEDSSANLTSRRIYFVVREGTKLDLGTKNKLASVTYGGGNAGANGGNVTVTFSYSNFNDLTVTHPQDPSGL